MKKSAGKVWAWFDSWTKRIAAGAVAVGILSGAAIQGHGYFAKSWEVVEIRVELSEESLLKVQDRIFELENARTKRPLTVIEERRLKELKEQERQIIEKIRRQQGK